MDSGKIYTAFHSDSCPICQKSKGRWTAFCPRCYRSLPEPMRADLWKRFGEGFEEAFVKAMACLEKKFTAAAKTQDKQLSLMKDRR